MNQTNVGKYSYFKNNINLKNLNISKFSYIHNKIKIKNSWYA